MEIRDLRFSECRNRSEIWDRMGRQIATAPGLCMKIHDRCHAIPEQDRGAALPSVAP